MLSIIFGACQQNFTTKPPSINTEENTRLQRINVLVTCCDLIFLVFCIVIGSLHAQMGFTIPPTVQWSLIEIGIGGIAMLAYKKVLPASKDDNITST